MNLPRPTAIRKKRPGLRALAFGLTMLGLCVFAWGLRYKLSLYDPPRAVSHHMAAAKLLTGRERNLTLLASAPRLARSVVPPLLSSLMLVLVAFAATRSSLHGSRRLLARSPLPTIPVGLRSRSSFIRPPPSSR